MRILKFFFQTSFPTKQSLFYGNPPWINNNIKQLIQKKSDRNRSYILNDKNPQIFHKVRYLEKQLKNLISERSQEKYYLRISKN